MSDWADGLLNAVGVGTTGVPWGTLVDAGVGLFSASQAKSGVEDTNAMNQRIAAQNSAFNAEQAQKTRDWETQMSNTAYQRSKADMEAAGLNPILMYSRGGASTPSGATASAVQPVPMQSARGAGVQAGVEGYRASGESRKRNQEMSIKSPLVTGAKMVDDGLKTLKEDVGRVVGEGAGSAVIAVERAIDVVKEKLGDVLTHSAAQSSDALDAASHMVRGRAGTPLAHVQQSVAGVVSSAQDYRERVMRSPEAASNMPSAREQAKRSGRRLGTLGRQPRYVPQYGVGE